MGCSIGRYVATVVLQGDGPAIGDSRQLGLIDHLDSVKHDGDADRPAP